MVWWAYWTRKQSVILCNPKMIHAVAVYGATFVAVPVAWGLAILIGVSQGIRFVTILALPVEMIPKEGVGTASGLILAIGFVGSIIGPRVVGRLFDLTGGLDLSFFILIGVWQLQLLSHSVCQKLVLELGCSIHSLARM